MNGIKPLLLIIASATAHVAVADAISYDFATGMPKTIAIIDGDGGTLQPNIYNHLGSTSESWFVGQLSGDNGRSALSATRYSDKSFQANNIMMLPEVKITTEDAYIRWQARSVHRHIPEAYKVSVRKAGTQEWSVVYSCDEESYYWTHHAASLSEYVGESIEVAFTATTTNGFMLAVDNIFVGDESEDRPILDVNTLSKCFLGENDPGEVRVRISNYGSKLDCDKMSIVYGANSNEYEVSAINHGESVELVLDIDVPMHEKVDYMLVANTANGDMPILQGNWVYRSHYPRTALVDRFSGTWCNQCPEMEPNVARLENLYKDELIVVESHIGNDILTDAAYAAQYADSIFNVPAIIANHRQRTVVYSLKDDFSSALIEPTIATISAVYTASGDKYEVDVKCEFAKDIDNAGDRYTVGYRQIADLHNPDILAFVQKNVAGSYRYDQYYYMGNNILPEMMWFDNVAVGCTYADKGIIGSLPETIEAGNTYTTICTLESLEDNTLIYKSAAEIKIIAYIIDTNDGHILNATLASKNETGALNAIPIDTKDSGWYTLQGVRLIEKPALPGIYINNGKKIYITN